MHYSISISLHRSMRELTSNKTLNPKNYLTLLSFHLISITDDLKSQSFFLWSVVLNELNILFENLSQLLRVNPPI